MFNAATKLTFQTLENLLLSRRSALKHFKHFMFFWFPSKEDTSEEFERLKNVYACMRVATLGAELIKGKAFFYFNLFFFSPFFAYKKFIVIVSFA